MRCGIQKELEAGISFQGAVHCLATAPSYCCFTCDQYLYVWPLFSPEPLPAFELPFIPATITSYDDLLLVLSSDSVVILKLEGDTILLSDSFIPPADAKMFPMVSGSTVSPSGQLACAYAGTSPSFLLVSDFSPTNSDDDRAEPCTVKSQLFAIEEGDNSASTKVIEHATFGGANLYLATKTGHLLAVSMEHLTEDNKGFGCMDVIRLSMANYITSPSIIDIVPGNSERCITCLKADPVDDVVYVGLDDGTLAIIAGTSHPSQAAFRLLSFCETQRLFTAERLKATLNNTTSTIRCPITDIALLGEEGLVGLATPLGMAFFQHSHETVPNQLSLVYIELSTSSGDGVAAASLLGDFGTSIAWHAFSKSVVLRFFIPYEQEGEVGDETTKELIIKSPPMKDQALPVTGQNNDEASSALEDLLKRIDDDPTRLGWAGVSDFLPQHIEAIEETPNEDVLPDEECDLLRAKRALGPKYTAPLPLKGAGLATVPSKQPVAKTPQGAKTPNLFTKMQTLQTKPVTFGRAIKGSGYGASNNTPWSVQQAQKAKKASAAAAKAKLKPAVVLGADPPPLQTVQAPNSAQYLYDVQKSTAPVNPKIKSNEVLSKSENKVHSGAITALCYNAAATAILTGSTDATLHMLKCPVATHKGEGRALRGHTAPVLSVNVGMATSQPLVVSGGRDGCIGVWCPTLREAPYVMENVAGPKDVTATKFFYQDKLIAAGVGSQIKFFRYTIDKGGGDLDRKRNLSRVSVADQYRTDAQSVTALDCVNSFLSTLVVWSGSNRQLGVIDIGAQRTVRRTEDAHTRPIHSLVLVAANARYTSPPLGNDLLHCYATAALDKTVKLWDLRTPEPIQVLSSHMNLSQQVGLCFSPCGRFVIVGSEDRSAFVYDVRAGNGNDSALARLPMPDVVTACSYHPLEPVVALGTASGDIRMFGV